MIIQKQQINHSGNVAKFKYLGMMVTDNIFTNDKIESRLNSRNTCYRSVQNLWSSCLLSRNIKTITIQNLVLPVALYECGTWFLKLREEHRQRVLENRVLRRIFGPKMDLVTEGWRKLCMGTFIICPLCQILLC
jgi:hypothetical protein